MHTKNVSTQASNYSVLFSGFFLTSLFSIYLWLNKLLYRECAEFPEAIIWEYNKLIEMKNMKHGERGTEWWIRQTKHFFLMTSNFSGAIQLNINYNFHILNVTFCETIAYMF